MTRLNLVRGRPGTLLLLLLAAVLLVVALLLDLADVWPLDLVPSTIGILPAAVPLGGALGGVAIAITALIGFWKDDKVEGRWLAWYHTRLPLGALFGSIAALIVVLFLGTVGVSKNSVDSGITAVGQATLFVVAFVVGYQQDVFRALLGRVVAIIVGPGGQRMDGDSGSEGVSLATDTAEVDFGTIAVGGISVRKIELRNVGQVAVRPSAAEIDVRPSAHFALTPRSNLVIPVGQGVALDVTFQPNAQGDHLAQLVVSVGPFPLVVRLKGTAT